MMANTIDFLEHFQIGQTKEWVLIRGRARSNPILLLLQAGPGFPIIHEAESLERLAQLEEAFTVVYWDQRACGKSFSASISGKSMRVERLVADTVEMVDALKNRLRVERLFIAGFSLGGSIAALTAQQTPQSFYALVAVGIDVDFDESERVAYQFVVDESRRRDNKKAMRDLVRLGLPPHNNPKTFQMRVKWLTNMGGVNRQETYSSLFRKTLVQMVKCPQYSFLDVARAIRGMQFCQKHLLPTLAGFNLITRLPRIDVPIYMFQGRHDLAAPAAIAERYYEVLEAPKGKRLIWFENSAHMPQYEEPEKFREAMLRIKEEAAF
jgi:proline iminopeptidase